MSHITIKSAVAPREIADENEADYGTVLGLDGFFARVRWHIARSTYTERLADLRLLGDEERRAYVEMCAEDARNTLDLTSAKS